MIKQNFYKPQLLVIGGQKTSDHSRQPFQISSKRIEQATRMADGTLRKYYVATKHEFSVSWDLLPHTSNFTVDGFMGARELESFYNANFGAFQLQVVSGQTAATGYTHQGRTYRQDTYLVHFTDFSIEIEKRGQSYDMYNVSMSMEEI